MVVSIKLICSPWIKDPINIWTATPTDIPRAINIVWFFPDFKNLKAISKANLICGTPFNPNYCITLTVDPSSKLDGGFKITRSPTLIPLLIVVRYPSDNPVSTRTFFVLFPSRT